MASSRIYFEPKQCVVHLAAVRFPSETSRAFVSTPLAFRVGLVDRAVTPLENMSSKTLDRRDEEEHL